MSLSSSRFLPSNVAQSRAVFARTILQTKVADVWLRQQLWLQAILDGEVHEVKLQNELNMVANTVEAQSLLSELNRVKIALAHSELERRVPQSRERYWSNIERAIRESATKEPAHARSGGLDVRPRLLVTFRSHCWPAKV